MALRNWSIPVGKLFGVEIRIHLTFLLLVAWLGSHSHSRECQEIGPGYTAGSCTLAERYLRQP